MPTVEVQTHVQSDDFLGLPDCMFDVITYCESLYIVNSTSQRKV